jgi:hypothetical protein
MIEQAHEPFYGELTSRNRGLISDSQQVTLRATRFVIAGCGSTGGACVMPLVRSGAERFVILDPGDYDVSNLNRQDATLAEVGHNKAEAARARVLSVNPYATVDAYARGVDPQTIGSILEPDDFVIDAVDVTTVAGLEAKLALHQAACDKRLRVLTAYDIGPTQWLEMFDYRRERKPLAGKVTRTDSPEQVLRALIPALAVPREIFAELLKRRDDPDRAFPQLAMTSNLLAALIVPYVLRLLTGQPVRRRMRVDLYDLVRPAPQRLGARLRQVGGLVTLWWRLRG